MDELTSKKQDVERANNEPQRHPTSVALSRPPATEVDAGTDVTFPHAPTPAGWGVPSPIVTTHTFRFHVGAPCSAGCDPRGKEIEICDETGAIIARGTPGEIPWDGTRALYWPEVALAAPAKDG